MKLFQEADAEVKKLKGHVDEAVKDMATAQSLQPSQVASGPEGLAL